MNYDFYEPYLELESVDIESVIELGSSYTDEPTILRVIYYALPEEYKDIVIPYMEHEIPMTKSAGKR